MPIGRETLQFALQKIEFQTGQKSMAAAEIGLNSAVDRELLIASIRFSRSGAMRGMRSTGLLASSRAA
jgi:hypothetical protein